MPQILIGLLFASALSIYTLYRRIVALKIDRNSQEFEKHMATYEKHTEEVVLMSAKAKEAYEKARAAYDAAASKPPKG